MRIRDLIKELNWMSSNIGDDSDIEVIKQDGLCIFKSLTHSIIFVEK